jgi:riboflavin transporter
MPLTKPLQRFYFFRGFSYANKIFWRYIIMTNTTVLTTKKMVALAILAALGIPLMYVSFGPVPAAPWLKFDLSDVVVYIAAVIYGPLGAVLVAFIKSLADFLLKGSEVGIPINQFIAFVSSLAYALPFYYTMVLVKKMIKRNNHTNKVMVRVIPVIIGTLSLTILLTFLNYVWLTPLYLELLGVDLPPRFFNYVVTIYGPFNFAKGAALSGVFLVLSFRLDQVARFLNKEDQYHANLLTLETIE